MVIDQQIELLEINRSNLQSFSERLIMLIEDALKYHNQTVHSVSARVKSKESFAKKFSSDNKLYTSMWDVHDIIGIRIITLFNSDIAKIRKIIEDEFSFDDIKSGDKRRLLGDDQFGYMSYHYICNLKRPRSNLIEYKNYKNIRFEIQIRSILQHAWAEIEHDIGYKSETPISREDRRLFSRIASLLEQADENFDIIRQNWHESNAKLAETIDKREKSIPINIKSLTALYNSSVSVEGDKILAEKSDVVIAYSKFNISQKEIDALNYIGFKDTKKLVNYLESKMKEITDFASNYIKNQNELSESNYGLLRIDNLSRGIFIFWGIYYYILTELDEAKLYNYASVREFVDFDVDFVKKLKRSLPKNK